MLALAVDVRGTLLRVGAVALRAAEETHAASCRCHGEAELDGRGAHHSVNGLIHVQRWPVRLATQVDTSNIFIVIKDVSLIVTGRLLILIRFPYTRIEYFRRISITFKSNIVKVSSVY